MRVQIAVVVKEEEYARRLSDYVSTSSFREQWQLTAFTHSGAVVRHLQGNETIDLLAIQPALLEEVRNDIPRETTIVLLVGSLGSTDSMYAELLQYQPVPDLLNGFAAALVSQGNGRSVSDGNAVVATICSPVGRCGKTTLALHLAQAAAARNRRPFYLNLERWSGSEIQLDGFAAGERTSIEAEGLSQLLYCVQSGPVKGAEWLAKHAVRHPYWRTGCLRPCSNQEDRLALTAADAAAVVEAVKAAGYDFVVIEGESGMDELQMGLMEMSSRVAWVLSDDPVARYKSEFMFRYAEQRWPDRLLKVKDRVDTVVSGCTSEANRSLRAPRDAFLLPDVPKWRHSYSSEMTDSPLYRAAADKLYTAWTRAGVAFENSGMVG